MLAYRCLCFLLVVLTNNLIAMDATIPVHPDAIQSYPNVLLPGSESYANKLIHRYNAQVDNPNFRVPDLEALKSDAKRGLQGWLPVVPDTSVFPTDTVYPLYQSGLNDGVLLLYLPPDQSSNIGLHIQERLRRFVTYTCKADGMPLPRSGRVTAANYAQHQASWQGAFVAGILLGMACLLGFRYLMGLRAPENSDDARA